jgi:hypothetical protein
MFFVIINNIILVLRKICHYFFFFYDAKKFNYDIIEFIEVFFDLKINFLQKNWLLPYGGL